MIPLLRHLFILFCALFWGVSRMPLRPEPTVRGAALPLPSGLMPDLSGPVPRDPYRTLKEQESP